jgi:hypothetical protein
MRFHRANIVCFLTSKMRPILYLLKVACGAFSGRAERLFPTRGQRRGFGREKQAGSGLRVKAGLRCFQWQFSTRQMWVADG